jgi:hypothetical protein
VQRKQRTEICGLFILSIIDVWILADFSGVGLYGQEDDSRPSDEFFPKGVENTDDKQKRKISTQDPYTLESLVVRSGDEIIRQEIIAFEF